MAQCSKRKRGGQAKKPKKPSPDFPLFPHATKRWAKKIRGRFHYFGPWDDPEGALRKYLDQKDDLHAGRVPRQVDADVVRVRDVCNEFLNYKRGRVDNHELAERTWSDYYRTCERLVRVLGKDTPIDSLTPQDFRRLRADIAERWGAVRLSNEIQLVRSVFKYGFDASMIDKPVRFGPDFKKPSAKVMRTARIANGSHMFEREELLAALQHAGADMKAMILLGVNGGLGNTDVADLRLETPDLNNGWLDYPRAKTGIERRIPLWPETIAAIRVFLADRPQPKHPADTPLLFINKRGASYQDAKRTGYRVTLVMRRLLQKAGLTRKGLSFYALRHTFTTIGERSRDKDAVESIMGHAPAAGDMSARYRERFEDARLRTVVDIVRCWLFGNPADA